MIGRKGKGMVVIDSSGEIIKYEALPKEYQQNLESFYEENGKEYIIDLGENKYSTYQQIRSGIEPADIRVPYGPDMFLNGKNACIQFGYAIAEEEKGNGRVILREEGTTYAHLYTYTGGADMWFLDEYECIFLHGCNEYSVELCQAVMRLWKGQRLILVGKDWERLIPLLPDLPEVECFYEEVLYNGRIPELTGKRKYLHILSGIPHAETMNRYENRIMTYDEVMSFVFMFSDYRELGEKNPDKNFFVMDGYYDNLGLFALFDKAVCGARYAKSRGFIPVIRLTKGSMYQDGEEDEIWEKFYCQPEGFSLEEVMESKHVYFSPGFYNGSIQSCIMNDKSADVDLTWPDGIYNKAVKEYIAGREKRFLPNPQRTLGVLARGTDYVHTHLSNHAIHASIELICEKIDEVWETWGGYDHIYLATEDEEYCRYFKERYSDRIYFTDQQRYVTKENELLAEHHKKDANKIDGFHLGVEYLLSIHLLAQCRSLIASGGCAGVREAIKQNGGKYEQVFVFDLGVN